MGVPNHLVALINNLYDNNTAIVNLDNKTSEPFKPRKGVRQGCILSPRLFNAYGEYIMRRALEGEEGGILVNGKILNNLRYADDTTLIAKSEEEMARLLERVTIESNNLGLEINTDKTKLMLIDRSGAVRLHNLLPNIERVDQFIYLGSLITNNGDCEAEIRRRIAMARTDMISLRKYGQIGT